MKLVKFRALAWLVTFTGVTTIAQLSIAQLRAQTHYTVTDLGPSGTTFSQALAINNYGLAAGVAAGANGASHAVLWYWGMPTDISRPGLGGPNSIAGAVTDFGTVVGQAETAALDPNKENFCGFGSNNQCLAFTWDFGTMTALPTLGGTNATFGGANRARQVVGIAETRNLDTTCPSAPAANGTGPLLYDFEAVIWGPLPGQIRELHPLNGDTVGMANANNVWGEVVGASGSCANTTLPGFEAAPHAILWDTNGTPHSLPSLGGSAPDVTFLGAGNVAFAINDHDIVAGQATLSDNRTFHPVLWQDGVIADLGVLSGDLVGAALAINKKGDVVGASVSAPGPASGNPRAWVWHDGILTDLNLIVAGKSPLYLLTAFGINDSDEIVGFGATKDGDLHAFLATPCQGSSGSCGSSTTADAMVAPRLSESARETLLHSGLRGR
jgi:probable HAF family extracellular repeat protein